MERQTEPTGIEIAEPSGTLNKIERHEGPLNLESIPGKQPSEKAGLLSIAKSLLSNEIPTEFGKLNNTELVKSIQVKLQENIKNHYRQTGLSDKIKALKVREYINPTNIPLDQQAANIIAEESRGGSVWSKMIPNLRLSAMNKGQRVGLNCRMASAMLQLALKELGYEGVRVAIQLGHTVVIRELPNNEVIVYDPTSQETQGGQVTSYSKRFQIIKHETNEHGYPFEIPNIKVRLSPDVDESKKNSFFAYNEDISMDIGVTLRALSEIKKYALVSENEQIVPFDRDKYIHELISYIKHNNTPPLSNEDIAQIGKNSRPDIEKLEQIAESNYRTGNGQIPNPYDFIKSELLNPKNEPSPPPNPKNFTGSNQQYREAREICNAYPELMHLDYEQINSQIPLFDGHDYL